MQERIATTSLQEALERAHQRGATCYCLYGHTGDYQFNPATGAFLSLREILYERHRNYDVVVALDPTSGLHSASPHMLQRIEGPPQPPPPPNPYAHLNPPPRKPTARDLLPKLTAVLVGEERAVVILERIQHFTERQALAEIELWTQDRRIEQSGSKIYCIAETLEDIPECLRRHQKSNVATLYLPLPTPRERRYLLESFGKNDEHLVSASEGMQLRQLAIAAKQESLTPKTLKNWLTPDPWSDIKPERLRTLEEDLRRNLIGQAEAIQAVITATARGLAHLTPRRGPVLAALFVGPSGSGKTEIGRLLARAIFKEEPILLSMNSYTQENAVGRLFGAEKGYVGYGTGSELTNALRERRSKAAVLILDEIEKAHPRVHKALLRVLDEGQLTTTEGEHIDLSPCILILTSNAGCYAGLEQLSEVHQEAAIQQGLQSHFQPEFLRRLEFIRFRAFGEAEYQALSRVKLEQFQRTVAAGGHYTIHYTNPDALAAHLATHRDHREPGGRSVNKAHEKALINPISNAILEGKYQQGDTITIKVTKDKKLVLK